MRAIHRAILRSVTLPNAMLALMLCAAGCRGPGVIVSGRLVLCPPDARLRGGTPPPGQAGALECVRRKTGVRHGPVVEWYPSGTMRHHSEYRDGKLHGLRIDYDRRGRVSARTHFTDGRKHGLRVAYWPNSKIRRKGGWTEGQMIGIHLVYRASGTLQARYVFATDIAGPASHTLYDERGRRSSEIRRLGGGFAAIRYWYSNGQLSKRAIVTTDRRLTGKVEEWWSNGKRNRVEHWKLVGKQSKLHGRFARWDSNGILLEERWHWHGGFDKTWRRFFDNGKLERRDDYVRGVRHGLHQRFSARGVKLEQDTFVHGELTARLRWYKNGKPKEAVGFRKGAKHGHWRRWHVKGHLLFHGRFDNNKSIGKHREWWPSGRAKSLCNFNAQGKKHGPRREWSQQGTLVLETFFDNGSRHGRLREWTNKGQLRTVSHFRQGLLHGRFMKIKWNNVRVVGRYKKDVRVGTWRWYSGKRRIKVCWYHPRKDTRCK